MTNQNLRNKCYVKIKQKIVDCVFQPGDFIKECELVEELGVSRTPIREALNKLEQDGLVKIIPRRGVLVLDIDYKAINDIFQVRLIIEPYIIRQYKDTLDPDMLRQFREQTAQAAKEGDRDKLYQVDDEFHRYLRSPCPNRYLHNLLENIYEQNQRLRILSGVVEKRLQHSVEEHIQIIDALLEEDTDKAVRLLEEHIAQAKQTAIRRQMEQPEDFNREYMRGYRLG